MRVRVTFNNLITLEAFYNDEILTNFTSQQLSKVFERTKDTISPGQDVKRYPWCANRYPKGFFVHQVIGLNI